MEQFSLVLFLTEIQCITFSSFKSGETGELRNFWGNEYTVQIIRYIRTIELVKLKAAMAQMVSVLLCL